jgi:hypothetical protein
MPISLSCLNTVISSCDIWKYDSTTWKCRIGGPPGDTIGSGGLCGNALGGGGPSDGAAGCGGLSDGGADCGGRPGSGLFRVWAKRHFLILLSPAFLSR